MTVTESINRTTNLLGVAITALAGFAFLPEVILETEPPFKIDDSLLFILGIAAIIWYKMGKNRFTRSKAPVIFVAVALLVKIMGVIIEIKEKDDVGDDFGGLILFICGTLFIFMVYKTSKKLLSEK